jgi:signal transduction histidine kinase
MNGVLFAVSSLFCFAGAALVLAVNHRRVINQATALALTLASLSFASAYAAIGASDDHASILTGLFWLRLASVAFAFIPWALWLMKNAIILDRVTMVGLINRSWRSFIVSAALAIICYSESFIPSDSTSENPQRGLGYVIFSICLYAYFSYVFISSYRAIRQMTGIRRIELQFFLLNACLSAILILVFNVLARSLAVPSRVYSPVMIAICLGILVWAICYHRVFDARHLIILITQRVSILAVLAGGTLLLAEILSSFLGNRPGLFIGTCLMGTATFYLNRASQQWLGLNPEHLQSSLRAQIISQALHESDPELLKKNFEGLLQNWAQTENVEILVRKGSRYVGRDTVISHSSFTRWMRDGWATPEKLVRLRPEPSSLESLKLMADLRLDAIIAAPRGSNTPSLLLAFGPKRSLRPYTYPDVSLLLNIGELIDNTLAHANLTYHAAKLNQMESVAMMSRSLAHDLNNLTTPVSAYLLHAEGRAAPGSVEAEVYEAARHSVAVMHNYIRESLFFARRLVPEFNAMNPAEDLAIVVRLSEKRATLRGVALNQICDPEIRFFADSVLFQRLALNLINNAIEASPLGGVIKISVTITNTERLCLTVEDQGSGIPRENLKRIFEPYFTTKDTGDSVRGLGLGLAICRKIVELHGGDIEAQNTPSKGARFTATFLAGKKSESSGDVQPVSVRASAETRAALTFI